MDYFCPCNCFADNGSFALRKAETVLVNQGNSQQSAVTKGLLYGKYRGAIVLAEGADSASVRLQLTEAVSALTGLNAGNICVLKMKGTG